MHQRRDDLRDFLRSRRANLRPQDVGFPDAGARRTKGLRREEVAVLAGVGVSWYTWLEQGRDIKVSTQVLDGISTALRLDEAERAHLYRLAGHHAPLPAPGPDGALPRALRVMLDEWMPSPAYVVDRHWNFAGGNAAAYEVFGYSGARPNCLVAFFTDEGLRNRVRNRAEYAATMVANFRARAASYPDDGEFGRIIGELRAESAEFDELWARHEVREEPPTVKEIDHPAAGHLVFERSTVHLAERPDLRLLLLTPRPGTGTRRALAALLGEREDLAGESAHPARSAFTPTAHSRLSPASGN